MNGHWNSPHDASGLPDAAARVEALLRADARRDPWPADAGFSERVIAHIAPRVAAPWTRALTVLGMFMVIAAALVATGFRLPALAGLAMPRDLPLLVQALGPCLVLCGALTIGAVLTFGDDGWPQLPDLAGHRRTRD
ncbi:MAG: hypothetical protein KGI40_01405 [Xanthomonadaceae bacterium]|nr:hypothetical protein [Xanthomonadaceae bacterium]MDE1957732.1 hypothetical protein [Xanthomonadaceae bacterium]MDE2177212.1 hypothetical protein [Xanthomonadaceae bacterium]MDE2244596.1 hypothetical protein [Xanthomonadaceae bacterium]